MIAARSPVALLTVLVTGLSLAACTASEPRAAASSPPAAPSQEPSGPAAEPPGGSETAPGPGPATSPAPDPADAAPQPTQDPQPPPTSRDAVEVVVTYAGPGTDPDVTEVVAYLPGLIEEGGTCTATLVPSGTAVSVPAWPDATSTSCELMELDVPPTAGSTVVVTYASPASSGTSATTEVSP
ncbi:hypothetical protein N866_05210 [Actinotalea ferrariae CF5-4]|uniref:Uncharacterized protein n=1 Tax=Actinotalea ferrariae CF5-4 TaxID=948458 RepID=A0A021VUC5_9CELL|nr:hypothetical protein [Actinotalea ferrariae]EYR64789.1 hypothetical protein N866_05210 [Actinotalea ferrariae CF5-4]